MQEKEENVKFNLEKQHMESYLTFALEKIWDVFTHRLI